jgi:hypothetical protein
MFVTSVVSGPDKYGTYVAWLFHESLDYGEMSRAYGETEISAIDAAISKAVRHGEASCREEVVFVSPRPKRDESNRKASNEN